MLRTAIDVLKESCLHCISVAKRAPYNGFKPTLALQEMHFPTQRQGHRIGVALGMKKGF